MPDVTAYARENAQRMLKAVGNAVYTIAGGLDITAWRTREPVPYEQRESGEELRLTIGDSWGKLFDCAWFRFCGQVPPSAAGEAVVLLLDVNGEMCVVDERGEPLPRPD